MVTHACEHCGHPVVRSHNRGRWPKYCGDCRSDPELQRELARDRAAARRATAEARVDALMRHLRGERDD